MAENRITIRFSGTVEDEGHVKLSAFIAQLESVKAALKQTERQLSGDDEPSVYYRVVDLSHNSPATVVLEAVSKVAAIPPSVIAPRRKRGNQTDYSQATVHQFFSSLKQIREKKQPPHADLQTLEAYRNLSSALDKNVSTLQIINTNESVQIDDDFRSAIDDIIGPDELVEGSICGMLERVNLHNTARFDIFPTIGPKQVTCDFKPTLRKNVIAALDNYVCVVGRLRYKNLQDFPYAINADSIEVLPPEQELPNLFDLKGIAPGITGDMDVTDFLEKIRDGENW